MQKRLPGYIGLIASVVFFLVIAPSLPVLAQSPQVLSTRNSCGGASTGSATISWPDGVGDYNGAIYDGNGDLFRNDTYTHAEPFSISSLPAGPYHVVLTDNVGNTQPVDFTIVENAPLGSLGATVNNIGCGASGGSIRLEYPYGGSQNYQYRLNEGSWQRNQLFDGLAEGTYTLEMGDFYFPECTLVVGTYTITKSADKPVISITANTDYFCNNLFLTATATPAAPYTYLWSSGQSSSKISLTNADQNGDYKVYVSAGPSCMDSATFTFTKQNYLAAYNVLGLRDVILGQKNTVNGSVGNAASGKTITIGKNSVINGYVRSSIVKLTQPVSVAGSLINTPANFALPQNMINNATVPSANVTIPDNGVATINTNNNNVTIGRAARVTINGTVYGKITIKEGAQVTFTQPVISINDIVTSAGKLNVNYTTINFTNTTAVRIRNSVSIGDRNTVNSNNVVFYMSNTRSGSEKFSVNGNDTRVNASVYMPAGKLAVWGTTGNCTMTGSYLVQDISSQNNVTWNSFNCSIPPANSGRTSLNTASTFLNEDLTEAFTVKAYPNPSFNEFTLQLGKTGPEPIVVSIYDATGKVLSRSTYNAGTNIKVGSGLKRGSYIAEIWQGKNRQMIKLLKIN